MPLRGKRIRGHLVPFLAPENDYRQRMKNLYRFVSGMGKFDQMHLYAFLMRDDYKKMIESEPEPEMRQVLETAYELRTVLELGTDPIEPVGRKWI